MAGSSRALWTAASSGQSLSEGGSICSGNSLLWAFLLVWSVNLSQSQKNSGASEPAAPLELGTNGGHLGSVICLSSHVSVSQSQPHTVFPAGRGVLAGDFTGLCTGKSPWVRTTQLPAQTWSAAAFCPADSVAQIFFRACPPSHCAPFSRTGQATKCRMCRLPVLGPLSGHLPCTSVSTLSKQDPKPQELVSLPMKWYL